MPSVHRRYSSLINKNYLYSTCLLCTKAPHQTVGRKYLYPSHLLVACWVAKNICICTFSINADMQSRQNSKRFIRTSYLYYTHFLINIYWHFIQNPDKIPKTHKFWGLKSIIDILFAYLLHSFKPLFSSFFRQFVSYLSLTHTIL